MNKNSILITKLVLVSVIALPYFFQVAHAAEWLVTGKLNPSAEYDDNTFLNEDDEGSMHYAMKPTLTLARSLENSEIGLSLGYQLDKYSSISNNDTENPFITFNSSYNTERSQYGLAASYIEATSRSIAEEDTGDFTTQSITRKRLISPSYSYQMTERDWLLLAGNYTERLYSTDDFSKNKSKSLTAGWQHIYSERLTGGLNLTVANYKSDSVGSSTDNDSYGLNASIVYGLSELWDISGAVGVRRLESEQTVGGITDDDQSSGSTLDFSATRTSEVDTYTFNVSRALSPSSSGDVNEQDRVSIAWSRDLSERLTAMADASYQETTDALTDASVDKRENIKFSPALVWNVEENLDLIMAYTYRKQKRDAGSNDSNAVSVTLSYGWDGIRFSR